MNNPNLGRMLRYYRKANAYSVQQVVDKLKTDYNISISPKTVYGWENSQNQPSPAICRYPFGALQII